MKKSLRPMPVVPSHDHAEDFYNDDNQFQVDADVVIGTAPTVVGSTGTWGNAFDPNNGQVVDFVQFNGDLYACGDRYIMRLREGTWAIVRTEATYIYHSLCVAWGRLFVSKQGTTFGTDTKVYVDVTDDGDTWENAYTSTAYASGVYACKLLLVNGIMYAGLFQYGVINSSDGITWGSAGVTTGTYRDLFVFNGYIYATAGLSGKTIKKFNGVATWATVYTSAYDTWYGHSWNGKAYVALNNGRVAYSADGASWTEVVVVSSLLPCRKFGEWQAKLLVGTGAGKAYQSADGLVWTEFYDHAETESQSWIEYEGKLYVGCGNYIEGHVDGTEGYIHVFTDATYVPAPNLWAYGILRLYGQFRPGDAPGLEGDLLLSGGASFPTWLARGNTGEYVAGVTGGKPVYKVIPASDVSFGPTSTLEATDVQAAIEELETEKGPAPIIKTDTGDPVSGIEGQLCVNTYDNTLKVYADAAWRSLATW